jgi:hypothetical protein
LHPAVCCDFVGQNRFIRAIADIISSKLEEQKVDTIFINIVSNDKYPTNRSLKEEIVRVILPFAEMDREDCDLGELACECGTASDATFLFSCNFRDANNLLKDLKEENNELQTH